MSRTGLQYVLFIRGKKEEKRYRKQNGLNVCKTALTAAGKADKIVIFLIVIYGGMQMDHMILGLLLLSGRTIYQLRERIAKGLNLMYSSSTGNIQAALKKLLDCGHIQYAEAVENGKYKKVYSITGSGKQRFFEWVNTPMSAQSGRNPELAKLYFMGFSAEENRKELLKRHISQLEEQYQVLDAICKDGETADFPDEYRDIGFYQLAAARYGRDFMLFNIEWYQKLLDKEEQRTCSSFN